MVTKKYSNLRKSLYALLIVLVVLTLSLSIFYITKYHIEVISTWQYNATYDFAQEVETDKQGQKSLVYKVSNGSQLAGAFRAINQVVINDGGGGGGTASGSGSSSGMDHTTMPDIEKDTTNKVIRLTNTVDLSGKTWKPAALSSGWTFDGAGFIIKNLTVSSSETSIGFISTNNGTIINIVFENANITNTDNTAKATNSGVVAGENIGTIENVIVTSGTVKGNSAATDTNHDRKAGGIVGYNNNENAIIRYCINYANIERAKFAGGIVANQYYGKIEYCYNYGSISCSYDQWPRLGGIVGEATTGTIQYCYNQGSISDTTSKAAGDIRAGGIVGMIAEGASVNYCTNKGTVNIGNTSTKASYVGGIVGYSCTNVTNCSNLANVTGVAEKEEVVIESGQSNYYNRDYYMLAWNDNLKLTESDQYVKRFKTKAFVGGILGNGSKGTNSNGVNVTNCFSTGTITGGGELIEIYVYSKIIRWHKNFWGTVITDMTNSHTLKLQVYDRYTNQQICGTTDGSVNNSLFTGTTSLTNVQKSISPNYSVLTVDGTENTYSNVEDSYADQPYYTGEYMWRYHIDQVNYMELSCGYDTEITSYDPNPSMECYVWSQDCCWGESANYTPPTFYGTKSDNLKTDATVSTLGSSWAIDASGAINDGYPYLINMYW